MIRRKWSISKRGVNLPARCRHGLIPRDCRSLVPPPDGGKSLWCRGVSGLYCWPGGGFGPSDLNNFGRHQISDLNCFEYESFHLNLPGVHLISEMYNAGLHQFSDWNHSISIRFPTSFFWCIKFPIWGILGSTEFWIYQISGNFFAASNFRFEVFWGTPNFRSELVQFIYLCRSTCSQDC